MVPKVAQRLVIRHTCISLSVVLIILLPSRKGDMKTISQRDAPRWALDSWWLDVKLGVRMLIKYPGLALVGGAGIAVAVAIAVGAFSFIYGAFLVSSVPLDQGDRIVSIEIWDEAANKPELRSLYDYDVWRKGLNSVQEIGAYRILMPNLIAPGAQPESVRVAAMSASGFRLARIRPLMGRYLEEEDEREGAPNVVVIGENVWRSRFAGDPAILGRTIQLGATPHSIIGVMPKSFAFPINRSHLDTIARALALLSHGQGRTLWSSEDSRQARRSQARRPNWQPSASERPWRFQRSTRSCVRRCCLTHSGRDDATGLLATQGLLVSLLVLVCLNVAILVYTRTTMRQAEIGVRSALGASRGRIVAQLFIEAFVLSVVAALAGVAIAAFGLRQVANAILPITSELPFWVSFRLSPGAVLYALVLSVLAAAIVGIVPALQATRRKLQSGLRVVGREVRNAARKDMDNPDRRAGHCRRSDPASGGLQRLEKCPRWDCRSWIRG